MTYLIFATCIWAFSFSLIGIFLSGQVDAYFSVLVRVILASAVFLPFINWSIFKTHRSMAIKLMLIGAIQLGLMYIFFYQSFLLISVPEVLIFTIFTPIYVTLLSDVIDRKLTPIYWASAALAIIGSLVIRYNHLSSDFFLGFAVVQGANLCFAIGQVAYKKLIEQEQTKAIRDNKETLHNRFHQHQVFGLFYLGALVVTTISYFVLGGDKLPQTTTQWGVLLWLGVVASGVGYFMWNKGATLVSTGSLAAMNNALIPAGLLVNLLIWNKDADIIRLALGGAIIIIAVGLSENWFGKRKIVSGVVNTASDTK